MCTLKHAFNAKDMNSLVYKILKGKVSKEQLRETEMETTAGKTKTNKCNGRKHRPFNSINCCSLFRKVQTFIIIIIIYFVLLEGETVITKVLSGVVQ